MSRADCPDIRTFPGLRARAVRQALLLAALVVLAATGLAPVAQAAPKRIVALTPFTANTLAALDVKPVGVGQTLGGKDRLSSKLDGVKTLPLSHPNGPNMEQLATLNPQLVFSSPTWRKGAATMRSLQIKVVESDPERVKDVATETERIGRLVGKEKAAKKLSKRISKDVAKASSGIKRRPKVLLLLGVGRTPFAFLPNSWGGDLVTKAGGKLLTAGLEANGGFARISDEVLLAENPDVIIAVPHANEDDIPEITKYMKDNPVWKNTTAGKDDRIFISSNDSLLQAGTDVANTIRVVRRKYLKN